MHLHSIYQRCLTDIGGESNKDVDWYLHERPRRILRKKFFRAATYAIWVAGISRNIVERFLDRALKSGFSWDYSRIGSWTDSDLRQFLERLHGQPVPKRAAGKWQSVHRIAEMLVSYSTGKDFRLAFFQGKSKSAELNQDDVKALVDLKLPYVKEATAQLIIRDMGGEVIKYDIWLNAFIDHFGLSRDELETQLESYSIPLGLFDIVIWAFCEQFVGRTKYFGQHFQENFS
jgi:hypothetical protein